MKNYGVFFLFLWLTACNITPVAISPSPIAQVTHTAVSTHTAVPPTTTPSPTTTSTPLLPPLL